MTAAFAVSEALINFVAICGEAGLDLGAGEVLADRSGSLETGDAGIR